jgi:pimeloyl-ACP methyl ester carboxylesterase
MPFITINNRTLHYLDTGEGPALLMGHNLLANHAVWREQVSVLSQRYRCIAPDLWGHGLSAPTPGNKISIRSLAEDYWILMQALDIKTYSILGLAMGGVWAIQMALDYPDSVNSLVLINPGAVDSTATTRLYYAELLNRAEQNQHVSTDMVDQLIPLFFSQYTQSERNELTIEFRNNLIGVTGANLSTMLKMGRSVIDLEDVVGNLDKLSVPTLILAGENARICGPIQSKHISEKIPGSDLRMIPNAGHMSCLEQPDIVNHHLQEFLGQVYTC